MQKSFNKKYKLKIIKNLYLIKNINEKYNKKNLEKSKIKM